ncbi:MAG: DUF4442 domain-containing protein [Candidatus Thiodiazotropha sp.]
MTLYQKIGSIGTKYIDKHILFKYGFNFSPMYRRSTAKITYVSKDLLNVKIKLPISYKNKNYIGSIFGGSLFSSVDPIPMVQLINLLEHKYIIWDKSAQIIFNIPARDDLYAEFTFNEEELNQIREQVEKDNETVIVKTTCLTNKDQTKVFCEVRKTIYISKKSNYRKRRRQ